MERRNILGKEFVIETEIIQGREMSIVGVVSTVNPNYVEFVSTRPDRLQPANGVFTNTMTIDEFFSDMRFLFSCLTQSKISEETLDNLIFKICDKHILKAGRLIDVDLYTYIDEVLIVIYTTIMKFYEREMNQDEISERWDSIKSKSFLKYRDDIFITRYELNNSFDIAPNLVKLSTIDNWDNKK